MNERFEMIELKKPTTELILLFQYVGLIVTFISNLKSQGRALASLFTLDFLKANGFAPCKGLAPQDASTL